MVFGAFFNDDSTNIAHIKDTSKSSKADKQMAAQKALRQWWMELQHQLEDEIKKNDGEGETDVNGKPKPFLLQATDTLQPLLDIAFYRYWDMDQVRETEGDSKGERYISNEQTYRFLDDLVRENEDAAVSALKDYLKYKLYEEEKGNEAVSKKSADLVEEAKKAALDKFDLQTAVDKADMDTCADLEAAIAKAKEASADVKAAEETLTKLQDEKQKKEEAEKGLATSLEAATVDSIIELDKTIRNAGRVGVDVTAASEKLEALKLEKKLKGKEEDPKAKDAREKKAAKDKETKEAKAKADAENLVKEGEKRAEERTALTEKIAADTDAEFSGKFKAAVDAVIADLGTEFQSQRFVRRQATYAKFRELLASKEKITQNEMNKIFNLSEAESFNSVCLTLGFNPDSVDAVMKKMSEKPKAAEGAKDDDVIDDDEEEAD